MFRKEYVSNHQRNIKKKKTKKTYKYMYINVPLRIFHCELMYNIFPNSGCCCSCQCHYWYTWVLMFQYIQFLIIRTEIMSPLKYQFIHEGYAWLLTCFGNHIFKINAYMLQDSTNENLQHVYKQS